MARVNGVGNIRQTVHLPVKLHNRLVWARLKRLKREPKLTVSAMVAEALEKYLNNSASYTAEGPN